MSKAQTWLVHASNALVGGTGLVYGWMRYFAESDDPYAIANHPWQPDIQHAHVLLAPLSVFAIGWIWSEHVLRHWRASNRRGRRTGITLALIFFPMVLSGYLLQVASEPFWREAWAWVHGIVSVLWILIAAFHPFLPAPSSAQMESERTDL